MSLQICLGEAGSGKSRALLKEIIDHAVAHPEMSHLLLVPEQFCLSAQRQLVALHPRHALLNVEALSFDRLAARAFRELGAEKTEILSDSAKNMFISLAVKDCRGRLQIYEKQSLRPGFVRRLSSLFAEWTMNDLGPERLAELSAEEGLPLLLRRKLADLALLFEAFKKRLGDKQTAEELLPRFARLLPRSRVGRVDRLYLDGYTGFTSVQYRILENLLRRCPETSVILTLPAGEDTEPLKGREPDLFALSRLSIQRLMACGERAGQIVEIRYLKPAHVPREEKAFLARHLFRASSPEPWNNEPEFLQLFHCPTPQEEADWALRMIRYLVEEKGLRYRDLAITVSDQSTYLPLLMRQLKEAEIPFFTDRREPLKAHPLVRLVGDALEAVQNMSREAVLRLIKNPYSLLSPEESDRFENYLLSAGIRRGKAFTEPFTRLRLRLPGEEGEIYSQRARQELEAMEALRLKLMTPLIKLKKALGSRPPAGAGGLALKEFLETFRGEKEWKALEAERLLVEEEGVPWQDAMAKLTEFLDSMQAILGEMPLSLQEFAEMVTAALESLSCGRLPMSPDQVLIGDIQRSRLGDIRALILLGLNDGLVPKKRGEGRLITDHERLALSFYEEELGYTDEKAMEEERFYLYSLFMKPREQLFLSYARRGLGGGQELLPAFVVEEIKKLYPRLADRAWEPRETARPLGDDPEPGPLILPAEAVEALYGSQLDTSISALESFAACPYRFFLERGLGLRERQELSWSRADHGSFFHKVAELVFRQIRQEGLRPDAMSPEEKQALIRAAVDQAVSQAPQWEWEDTAESRYSLERWKRFFLSYLDYWGERGSKDGYVPHAFELFFGPKEATATRLDLTEGRSLQLRGIIDRLDIREIEDSVYLRVVDYKTKKNPEFKPGSLVEGLQLQLAVYLDVALRLYEKQFPGRTLRPGGLCYGSLAEQLVAWNESPEKTRRLLWKKMDLGGLKAQETAPIILDEKGKPEKQSGLVSSRKLELVAAYARDKMRRMGEEIYGGDISPAPRGNSGRSSCSYCACFDICPFDEERKGCALREEGPPAQEAWEIISGESGKGAEENEVQS